ncbi:unnamed protein product [Ilex paraguariensis]|uniref:Uncharacterized protein n=1 Tax=Ilex paraguariensis TaxID=185542 RepID=A0ABC8S163_9AQUA
MSSIFHNFQSKQALPVSQPDSKLDQQILRRRLSSLSLKIQPAISSSATSWANFRRSKSVSSMSDYAGGSVRKWWDWGWAWILSRKPTFATDLEMNEEETVVLGGHNKGSWRHVLYKVRSELRRAFMSSDKVGLPQSQTFRYDSSSSNYSKNFEDGNSTLA